MSSCSWVFLPSLGAVRLLPDPPPLSWEPLYSLSQSYLTQVPSHSNAISDTISCSHSPQLQGPSPITLSSYFSLRPWQHRIWAHISFVYVGICPPRVSAPWAQRFCLVAVAPRTKPVPGTCKCPILLCCINEGVNSRRQVILSQASSFLPSSDLFWVFLQLLSLWAGWILFSWIHLW